MSVELTDATLSHDMRIEGRDAIPFADLVPEGYICRLLQPVIGDYVIILETKDRRSSCSRHVPATFVSRAFHNHTPSGSPEREEMAELLGAMREAVDQLRGIGAGNG